MKKVEKVKYWLLFGSVVVLILLVVSMLLDISKMQGNARVINYTGIVRSATQRLVKQETAGYPNDALVDEISDILAELAGEAGEHKIIPIGNSDYQQKLLSMTIQWKGLKAEILNYRQSQDPSRLYHLSEEYYYIADAACSAAESYAQGIAQRLRGMEYVSVVNIALILLLFLLRVVEQVRLAQQNKSLNSMAYVDGLTGLPNKRLCEEKLMQEGMLEDTHPVCCMMFDLNNLKTVNDTLGHKAGDALIISFANVLRRSATARIFIGRYGGDEFIAILRDTSRREITEFLSRLTNNINALNSGDSAIRIRYAYGYAYSPEYESITIRVLMDEADKKMYIRKAEMKRGMVRGEENNE